MQLHKIRLENIRSYEAQEISFPVGSTLLSGDIGSGKSTILIAAEFALFGLNKGEGGALLRNGRKNGLVELYFSIDKENICVKRALKKKNESIVQDSGHIVINGIKKEKMPNELKEAILEIFNYPKSLVTKSRDMIYKYTVYTPQEEMKTILLGDKNIRLDILRRVFGIEKYKQVKENSKIFIAGLKEKMKEFAGFIADLEHKKDEISTLEKRAFQIKTELSPILSELEKTKRDTENRKQSILSIEEKIKKLASLKKDMEINQAKIRVKQEQINRGGDEVKAISTQIGEIKSWLDKNETKTDIAELEKKFGDAKKEIINCEAELKTANKSLIELELRKKNSLGAIKNISELNTCPTCKQIVCKEHKDKIITMENMSVDTFSTDINSITEKILAQERLLKELNTELENLREDKMKFELVKSKKSNLDEKIKRLEGIANLQKSLEAEIIELDAGIKDCLVEINLFESIENEYNLAKRELDNLLETVKAIEVKKAELEREYILLKENMALLNEEIWHKTRVKDALLQLMKVNQWLEEHFLSLVELVEKQVMLKAHHDFSEIFQKWFNILIDDERLAIKIDDTFSPLIEQDGYNNDYTHLSGGEKTAAAFAYRLALNQVINNLMSGIKTNGLLILDEPTDGFSEQQLDKLRDVLQELKTNQIIIVSHENKIESFVDNVIRFEKINGISRVVSNT